MDFDYFNEEEERVEFGDFLGIPSSEQDQQDLPIIGEPDGKLPWLDEQEDCDWAEPSDRWDGPDCKRYTKNAFPPPRKVAFWNFNQYMTLKMAYHRATNGPSSPLNFILLNASTFEPSLDLIQTLLPKYDVKEAHIYLYGKVVIPTKPGPLKIASALLNVDGKYINVHHDQIVIIRLTTKPLFQYADKTLFTSLLQESKNQACSFSNFQSHFGDTFVTKSGGNEKAIKSSLLSDTDYTVFHSLHPYVDVSSRGFQSDTYLLEVFSYINEGIEWRVKNCMDERKKRLKGAPCIVGFSRIPPSYVDFPSADGLRIRRKGMPRSSEGFMPDELYDPNFYRLWLRSKECIPYIIKILESDKYLQSYDILRLYSDEEFDCQWRHTFGVNFNEIYTTTQYKLLPQNIVSTFFPEVGIIPQTAYEASNKDVKPLFLEASYDAFIPYKPVLNENKQPIHEIHPHSADLLSFDLECANHVHSLTGKIMFPIAYLTPQSLQRTIGKTFLPDAAQKRINAKVLENKCPDFCKCAPCKKLTADEREEFKLNLMKNLLMDELNEDERIITEWPKAVVADWMLDPVKDVDKVLCICFAVSDIESSSVSEPCSASYTYILVLNPDNYTGVEPIISEKVILASKRFFKTKVIVYETEIDLILGFLDHIRFICPAKISGYNINGFDIPYLQDRFRWYAKYGTKEEKKIVIENPFSISLISGFSRSYTTKSVFRPNLGLRTVYTVYPFLYTILDVLEGVGNETFSQPSKIRSFKLNSIAASNLFFPGTTKPMLKLAVDASHGVEMWRGRSGSRTLFLFYCLWDSVLALGLSRAYGFSKLMDTVATAAGIIPSYVYSTGVIEKIISLYRIFNFHNGKSRGILPSLKGNLLQLIHHPNIWLFSPSRCCDEDLTTFPYKAHLICEKTGLIWPHILEVASRRLLDNTLKGDVKSFLPSFDTNRMFFPQSSVQQKLSEPSNPMIDSSILGKGNPVPEIKLQVRKFETTTKTTTSGHGLRLDFAGKCPNPRAKEKTPPAPSRTFHRPSFCPEEPVIDAVQSEVLHAFPRADFVFGTGAHFQKIKPAIDFLNAAKERVTEAASRYLRKYYSESKEDKLIRYWYHYRLRHLFRLLDKLLTAGSVASSIHGEDVNNNSSHVTTNPPPTDERREVRQLNLLTGEPIVPTIPGRLQKTQTEDATPQHKPVDITKKSKVRPFVGGHNHPMIRCYMRALTVFKDFNSLYPSIMQALYLCFETLFTIYMSTHVYPDVSPFMYSNETIGLWSSSICGEYVFDERRATREFYNNPALSRTGWVRDPDCLSTQIVDSLLKLRNIAKEKMAYHTNLLCQNQFYTFLSEFDGRPLRELIGRLLDPSHIEKDNDEFGMKPNHKLLFLEKYGIKEVKNEMIAKVPEEVLSNKFNAREVVKKEELEIKIAIIFHKNQKKNFDINQNGFKILNNSIFGFFGSGKLRDLAATICGKGRFLIQLTAVISSNTCVLSVMNRYCDLAPYVLSIGLHPGAWMPHLYDPNAEEPKVDPRKRHFKDMYFSKERKNWPLVTDEHKHKQQTCSTMSVTFGGDTDSTFNALMNKFLESSKVKSSVPVATLSMIPKERHAEFPKEISYYEMIKKAAFYETGRIMQDFLPLEYKLTYDLIPPSSETYLNVDHTLMLPPSMYFYTHSDRLLTTKGNSTEGISHQATTEPYWHQVAMLKVGTNPNVVSQKILLSTKYDGEFVRATLEEIIRYLNFTKTDGFLRFLVQKIIVEKISDFMIGYGKKRYAFNNLETKKLVLKGISLVRGDALPVTSRLLKQCFDRILFPKVDEMLNTEKVNKTKYSQALLDYLWKQDLDDVYILAIVQTFEFLRKELEKLSENRDLDINQFTLSQRLKKDPAMYTTELPHVSVAIKLIQRGDTSVGVGSTIRYVHYLDPLDNDEKSLKALIAPTKAQLKPMTILKQKVPTKGKDDGTSSISNFFKPKPKLSTATMTGSLLQDLATRPHEMKISHIFKQATSQNADTPEYVVQNGYSLDLKKYIDNIIATISIALSPFISGNKGYPKIVSGMSDKEIEEAEAGQTAFVEEQKRLVAYTLTTDTLLANLENVIEHHNSMRLSTRGISSMKRTNKCITCSKYFRETRFIGFTAENKSPPLCPVCARNKVTNVTKAIEERKKQKQGIIDDYGKCVKECEECILRSEVGLNPDALNEDPETIRVMDIENLWKLVTVTSNKDVVELLLRHNDTKYESSPFLQETYPADKWNSNYLQCKYEECPTFRQRSTLSLTFKNVEKTLQDLKSVIY